MSSEDVKFVRLAIEKARESAAQSGFPAGAVIVKNGQVIGVGLSLGNHLHDPTSHGEMVAIREACKNLRASDLSNAVLYASMQPCLMCFGAAMWGLVSKIAYACAKEKVSPDYYGGHYEISAINTGLIHPIELTHVSELEKESLALIQEWEARLSKS